MTAKRTVAAIASVITVLLAVTGCAAEPVAGPAPEVPAEVKAPTEADLLLDDRLYATELGVEFELEELLFCEPVNGPGADLFMPRVPLWQSRDELGDPSVEPLEEIFDRRPCLDLGDGIFAVMSSEPVRGQAQQGWGFSSLNETFEGGQKLAISEERPADSALLLSNGDGVTYPKEFNFTGLTFMSGEGEGEIRLGLGSPDGNGFRLVDLRLNNESSHRILIEGLIAERTDYTTFASTSTFAREFAFAPGRLVKLR